ncbi:peptidoglycan-associated lipoprotein Pal [Halomonas sp. ML-15]|uniref:peptidoglycan-associated lipoprotein Pal n=1 Tax=Halomonas sp. ML-15 TaxID=2773305 RepID=UPI001747CB84|nr:peptidoglycan-associated lipoprotein Pal [Halomonas sp. ML-15]MBD3894343.1 peptidoglycan-associated lipoprotein Pal [Halomonas sp. ML-15]
MQFSSYAKGLALAASLALVAGCSSSGGTQDGSMDGTSGSGAAGQGAGSGQVSGTGMNGGNGSRQASDDQGIPSVRTIYFDFDRDSIRSEFESVLNAHAQYLRSNPNARVVLEGHTDERGTREYNMGLGERRANSVQRFMSVQGVSPSQLEVVSYGEERPAVRGNNEDSYAQNRRVVFSY